MLRIVYIVLFFVVCNSSDIKVCNCDVYSDDCKDYCTFNKSTFINLIKKRTNKLDELVVFQNKTYNICVLQNWYRSINNTSTINLVDKPLYDYLTNNKNLFNLCKRNRNSLSSIIEPIKLSQIEHSTNPVKTINFATNTTIPKFIPVYNTSPIRSQNYLSIVTVKQNNIQFYTQPVNQPVALLYTTLTQKETQKEIKTVTRKETKTLTQTKKEIATLTQTKKEIATLTKKETQTLTKKEIEAKHFVVTQTKTLTLTKKEIETKIFLQKEVETKTVVRFETKTHNIIFYDDNTTKQKNNTFNEEEYTNKETNNISKSDLKIPTSVKLNDTNRIDNDIKAVQKQLNIIKHKPNIHSKKKQTIYITKTISSTVTLTRPVNLHRKQKDKTNTKKLSASIKNESLQKNNKNLSKTISNKLQPKNKLKNDPELKKKSKMYQNLFQPDLVKTSKSDVKLSSSTPVSDIKSSSSTPVSDIKSSSSTSLSNIKLSSSTPVSNIKLSSSTPVSNILESLTDKITLTIDSINPVTQHKYSELCTSKNTKDVVLTPSVSISSNTADFSKSIYKLSKHKIQPNSFGTVQSTIEVEQNINSSAISRPYQRMITIKNNNMYISCTGKSKIESIASDGYSSTDYSTVPSTHKKGCELIVDLEIRHLKDQHNSKSIIVTKYMTDYKTVTDTEYMTDYKTLTDTEYMTDYKTVTKYIKGKPSHSNDIDTVPVLNAIVTSILYIDS